MPRVIGNGKDLVEIFGYAPDDLSPAAQVQWNSQQCPFIGDQCVKRQDRAGKRRTGVCSVTGPVVGGARSEVIACWARLYAHDYTVLRKVAQDAFGSLPFFTYEQYKALASRPNPVVVAVGKRHGKEIGIKDGEVGSSLDWVLVEVRGGKATEIVGVEVQSIDTTENYHASREDYGKLHDGQTLPAIRQSEHGLNWANVWKRLIPQLILKGPVFEASSLCNKGLYFVLPDEVYKRFEAIAPAITQQPHAAKDTVSVFTWSLGPAVPYGQQRTLDFKRKLHYRLEDLIEAFTTRNPVKSAAQLDAAVEQRIAALHSGTARREAKKAGRSIGEATQPYLF